LIDIVIIELFWYHFIECFPKNFNRNHPFIINQCEKSCSVPIADMYALTSGAICDITHYQARRNYFRANSTSAWFIAGIMQRQASEWIRIVAQRVPNVSGRASACAPCFFSVFNAVFSSVWWTPCILHSYRKDKIFLTFIVRVFIIWKNPEFLKDLLLWKICDFYGILWVLIFDQYANFGDF